MPLTLEDIARLANVSRSTVSRVLNNDPNVRPETRARVEAVIREVNFQPNLAARSLVARRTDIVGLVIPAGTEDIFSDPYFGILIQGVSQACNARDYSVMLWLAEPAYERMAIRKILHGGLLDGVIVSSMLIDDPIVEALYQSDMPFVLVGRHPLWPVHYVDVDNVGGARAVTEHLIRSGRRRIATITGPRNMIAGIDRFQGYCEALEAHGLPVLPELVVEGNFSERSGYEGMQRLLEARPDAVFAASDMMALGALQSLRRAGLRVPDDVALVGFDDIPAAERADPPLTTVRQPIHEMGYQAVMTLLDVIQHPGGAPRQVMLPTELVIRESCGGGHGANERMSE